MSQAPANPAPQSVQAQTTVPPSWREKLPDGIGVIADLASIATAGLAAWAYWRFRGERRLKLKRLETYLKAERDKGKDQGMRTTLHLVRHVGLTESEILNASFM